jgi:hypothetical protein
VARAESGADMSPQAWWSTTVLEKSNSLYKRKLRYKTSHEKSLKIDDHEDIIRDISIAQQ